MNAFSSLIFWGGKKKYLYQKTLMENTILFFLIHMARAVNTFVDDYKMSGRFKEWWFISQNITDWCKLTKPASTTMLFLLFKSKMRKTCPYADDINIYMNTPYTTQTLQYSQSTFQLLHASLCFKLIRNLKKMFDIFTKACLETPSKIIVEVKVQINM